MTSWAADERRSTRMASLFAPCGSVKAPEVARDPDAKIEKPLIEAALP